MKSHYYIVFFLFFFLSTISVQSQGITPKKTHEFVSSMGINIKLDRSRYNKNDGFNKKVKPALKDLGVRHIRCARFDHSTYGPQSRQLWEQYGIQSLYVTAPYEGGLTPYGVYKNSKAAADYLYAIEGANEPDIFLVEGYGWPYHKYTDRNGNTYTNTSSSYKATRAWHQDMVNRLQQDQKTKNIPIATTPMAFSNNVKKIIPITHDIESFHHYTHRNPVTSNLSNIIRETHQYAQGNTPKLMILSEFGWKSGTGTNAVTESTQAKNILTVFCEYFNRGVKVSYIHELIKNDWGLLKENNTRKPAFKALKNVITVLDEGTFDKTNKKWNFPNFTPKKLEFELLNAHNDTHKLLLQKSNGEYYLLLWRNVDRSNDDGTDKDNWDDTLQIKINGTLTKATQFRFNDAFDLKESSLSTSNNTIEVKVPDNIIIVKLTASTQGISTIPKKIESKSNKKVIKGNINDGNGATIVQYSWKGWNSQRWKFLSVGSGYYKIENRHTKLVLQTNNNNIDGATIIQNKWKNLNTQQWKLIPLANNYYRIVNKENNKCITAFYKGNDNDPIRQYGNQNWDTQKWKIIDAPARTTQQNDAEENAPNIILAKDLNKLTVYPNPASNILDVYYFSAYTTPIAISIIDIRGIQRLQHKKTLHKGINNIEFDVSSLPIGAYKVILEVAQEKIVKSIIISKK